MKKKPKVDGEGGSVRGVLDYVYDMGVRAVGAFGMKDMDEDEHEFIEAESQIRAIIRKEVVEEFWQEICKLYWNGNVEVDDATVTVMELVDIRNKILAKGE